MLKKVVLTITLIFIIIGSIGFSINLYQNIKIATAEEKVKQYLNKENYNHYQLSTGITNEIGDQKYKIYVTFPDDDLKYEFIYNKELILFGIEEDGISKSSEEVKYTKFKELPNEIKK